MANTSALNKQEKVKLSQYLKLSHYLKKLNWTQETETRKIQKPTEGKKEAIILFLGYKNKAYIISV